MAVQYPRFQRSFKGGQVLAFEHRAAAEVAATDSIIERITGRHADQDRVVLGLATGSTPIGVYRHLAALVGHGALSFDRVTTFNLDEYYPMSGLNPQSYRHFMDRHLFQQVRIAPNRAHLLDGTVPESATAEHAAQFDRWIDEAGGIDLQILGLGRNGHIGFNEPSDLSVAEALATPTRLVDLHPTTRADAARDFGSLDAVPRQALTMGLRSTLR